jgi:hypothetical protein
MITISTIKLTSQPVRMYSITFSPLSLHIEPSSAKLVTHTLGAEQLVL